MVNYSIGKTPPRKEIEYWNNGRIPWVSISDLVANGMVTETKEHVNEYAARNVFKGKISKSGTLLMSFKLTVGKVSITEIDAFHNEAIISIYPFVDSSKITTKYLFFILPIISQDGETKSAIKGKTLNSISLGELLLPLPPLAEQKRIVEELENILPLVKTYGEKQEQLEKLNESFPEHLKKSILQEAVQGKLVPQDPSDEPASVLLERIRKEKEKLIKEGKIKKSKNESIIYRRDNSHYEKLNGVERCIDDEIPFQIPDSWEWVRLDNICLKIVDGSHNPPKGSSEITNYIMISSTNINNNNLVNLDKVRYLTKDTYYKENSRTNATKGDILFTSVGSLGRSCIYQGEINICFQRSVSVITTTIYNFYLKIFLDNPHFQNSIQKESTGTAQKGFYLKQLKNTLIAIPPLNEQKRIVEKLNSLLSNIEQL